MQNETINTTVLKMLLSLAAVLIFSMNSCIFSGAYNSAQGKRIEAKLYYHYPISSFDKEFYATTGTSPNHPDGELVEVKKNTGMPVNSQYGIRASYSPAFSQENRSDIILNLETGVIAAYAYDGNGNWESYTIPPPDQGGDYFDYLSKLETIEKIAASIAEGVDHSNWGPDQSFPSRPELNETIRYINSVIIQIKRAQSAINFPR